MFAFFCIQKITIPQKSRHAKIANGRNPQEKEGGATQFVIAEEAAASRRKRRKKRGRRLPMGRNDVVDVEKSMKIRKENAK